MRRLLLDRRVISPTDDISVSITFIVIGSIFGSFMVLILLPLFFFSTRETRKRPVFYLSIASLILGIIEGFMLAHLYVSSFVLIHSYTAVLNLLLLFSPLPVGAILLLRIVLVYPHRLHRFVLPPPMVLTTARLINMVVAIYQMSTRPWNFIHDWNHLPFSKVEWIFQLLTNMYAF
ncbi:hypothetical protein B0H13DRAFT_1591216 [Mycena leptocephala]|nr:hypothetical protein B0H13DRAFT_1599501 [Mycena leptocephala]KAJ7935053.1 hypothetical protein B0H13DRAFT_1591216 [Mycena leptocephala]